VAGLERVDEWKKQIAAKLPPEDAKLLEDYEGSWLVQNNRQGESVFSDELRVIQLSDYGNEPGEGN
jgi:hypothetical protein